MAFLSQGEIDAINAVSITFSVFSLLGSSFIISCYFCFKSMRKFSFTLVLLLSISDFLNQIGDFILPPAAELEDKENVGPTCIVQAVWSSFFDLVVICWTVAIAATLWLSVFKRVSVHVLEKRFWIFHLVCYGFPLIQTIYPWAMGTYGPAGGWCWITREYNWLRFVQFYIPLWVAILFNSIVYFMVIRVISRTFKTRGRSDEAALKMRQIINRLRWYPVILVVVWFWGSVNRIVEGFNGGEPVFWLYIMQNMFSSSQGLLNALAYGLSAGMRENLRDAFDRRCPSLKGLCSCRCRCCRSSKPDLVLGADSEDNSTIELHSIDVEDPDFVDPEQSTREAEREQRVARMRNELDGAPTLNPTGQSTSVNS